MATFFDTPIEFLKGVGPQRAAQLNRELSIFTYGDLIQHYPFRYEDRTRFYSIRDITDEMQYVQVKGTITRVELQGEGRRKRLTALFKDDSGQLDLVWFQGINWIAERLKPNVRYTVFGKPTRYGTRWSMVHPEFEVLADEGNSPTGSFFPVYPLTEKLRTRRLDSKFLSRLMQELLTQARGNIKVTLPASLSARTGL